MKISEVMGITGLTKKAINYYEEEGLLAPPVNSENNYRDYSVEDVNRLIQISILRQLDVPVKEIKEVLHRPESLKEKLQFQIKKLDNDISRLNKCRNIIDACISEIEEDTCTLTGVTKKLSVLNEALKMDDKSKIGYMKTQLLRVFPGNFGKLMVAVYGHFLNEPVNTPEKEAAWLSLVKLMDETEPFDLPEEMAMVYSSLSEEDIKKMSESYSYIDKMIDPTEEYLDEMKSTYLDSIKKINENESFKQEFSKMRNFEKSLKVQMDKTDFNKRLNESLKILSSGYSRYLDNLHKVTQFVNVDIDDDGNLRLLT